MKNLINVFKKAALMLLLFMVCSSPAFSQNADSIVQNNKVSNYSDRNLQKAGDELIKFSNNAQIGFGLMFAGTVSMVLPNMLDSEGKDPDAVENRRVTLTAAGVVASAVGLVVLITSFSNARNAGKLLKVNDKLSLNQTNDGIGFVMAIE